MNAIDPFDPAHHDAILWCVYGPTCFPTMFCCKIGTQSSNPAIWGYSEYKRSPGFRTLGREITGTWITDNGAKFFTSQQAAFDYLQVLTTPKCDVAGNKLPKKKKCVS